MKLGKEYILDKNEFFKTILGTINNKNFKSFYINLNTWITPNFKNIEEYKEKVNKLNKLFRRNFKSIIDEKIINPDFYIFDFDIRDSILTSKNKVFLKIDITLFTKDNNLNIETPAIKSQGLQIRDYFYKILSENFDFIFEINKTNSNHLLMSKF